MLAVFNADWRWLAWLPMIYFLSFVVWPRGFWRIAVGHMAIVAFWSEHWPRLGAHMIRHSPIYGDGSKRAGFYAVDGWRGLLDFLQNALQQNFFVVPAVVAAVLSPQDIVLERFLLGWIGSVYLAAILIHVVPTLRGIGLGRQYIKFAIVPTAILIGETATGAPWSIWVLAAGAAALTIVQYFFAARSLGRNAGEQSSQLSEQLSAVLQLLKTKREIRLLCLPTHLCDLIAYNARIPVYWGTHSDCFDRRLAAFFPVMQQHIADYVRDGGLTHLLLDTRYATPEELGLDHSEQIIAKGPYVLQRISLSKGEVQV
jgi:hypothetical protein